ncbi:MAG TPA: ABC transporter permease subunit [Fimbriimonadaceae bacterium]|nr:ABC transporter permease subunit [Fimbriimonadaceae bacterium]
MGAYLYFSSVLEFIRAKRLIPWLLLAVAGMGLAVAWPFLNRQADRTDQYTTVSAMLVFHVLALASAIYSLSIVSQEVEQKTIVYLLTRPVPRWKLLLARYFASATVVALLGILGAVLVSFGVYKGGAFGNPLLVKDIVALIFGAFAYGALFLLVSLLLNRAMIICLLFAFGWETIVPNMPGEMYRLSVYTHVMAIADHPAAQTTPGPVSLASGSLTASTLTPGSAYVTLLVLGVVLLAMSAAWFTHFEYVPREDAE